MDDITAPMLLQDKLRLPEIYKLRVSAWEHSENSKHVNHNFFPHGWYDNLDKTAFHWVITDIKNRIIGSARLNVINNLAEIPNKGIFAKFIKIFPAQVCFYSRLCIHPDFKNKGLSSILDFVRIEFIKHNDLALTLATSNGIRTNKLQRYGFTILGQENISFAPNAAESLFADFIALELDNKSTP